MAMNRGKIWEKLFQEAWERSFPGSFILRIPDQQSGYLGTSGNICDFIGFVEGKLFLIECKSTKGNTLPLSNLTQYEKLLKYEGIDGVRAGFAVWWCDRGDTAWVPISEVEKMKEEGKKSIHVDFIEDSRYNIKRIPNVVKRVYPRCDVSCIASEEE